MAFELRHLRHLLMLAEHGSFARAAFALGLSQPALSRSIQSLEARVGAELFVRGSGGVVPTDFGRVLLERARQLVRQMDELQDELLASSVHPEGRVAVGAGPFPAETVLGDAARRFVERHPGVSLRLQVGNWDDLLQQLRTADLDFFIAETSTLSEVHDLVCEAMPEQPIFFVARDGHPLGKAKGLKVAEMFACPIVTPSRIAPRVLEPLLAAQREWAQRSGGRVRAFPSCECNALSTLKRVVEGSDAITALPLSSIEHELAERRWRVLGRTPWLTLRYGLVRMKQRSLSRAADGLRAMCHEAAVASVEREASLVRRWVRGSGDG